MTDKQEQTSDLDEIADNWVDPEIKIDAKERKFCCDTEKRKRIEQLREARELERELREFYDD